MPTLTLRYNLFWDGYAAIILPCQELITLAPLPQSISVWRTRLAGSWQLLSAWVGLFRALQACTGVGERKISEEAPAVGLQPLQWRDSGRIYVFGGLTAGACVFVLLSYTQTCFLRHIFPVGKPGLTMREQRRRDVQSIPYTDNNDR